MKDNPEHRESRNFGVSRSIFLNSQDMIGHVTRPVGHEQFSNLKDGEHLAFAWHDEAELKDMIVRFVQRSISKGDIFLLLVPKTVAEKYVRWVGESGIDVQLLMDKGEFVIDPIDGFLQENNVNAVIEKVDAKVEGLGRQLVSKRANGLSIIGEIAGNKVKQKKIDEALMVELFWHRKIANSKFAVSLICPYEEIPNQFRLAIQDVHNCPLFIDYIWEIIPANYACAKCGKQVTKEVMIHEPQLICDQASVVSAAMRQNDAGYLPFCFGCISNHPLLKPPWIVLGLQAQYN